MSNLNYTWEINWLKKINTLNAFDNVVIEVSWTLHGEDAAGNRSFIKGVLYEEQPSLDENEFVPFKELTQDIVLGWIHGGLTEEQLQYYKQQVQNIINEKINTATVTGGNLPWNEPVPDIDYDRPRDTGEV